MQPAVEQKMGAKHFSCLIQSFCSKKRKLCFLHLVRQLFSTGVAYLQVFSRTEAHLDEKENYVNNGTETHRQESHSI